MDLNALHDAVAPWLDSLAELTKQKDQLEADLAADPRYAQLLFIKASIDKCEEQAKDILKGSGVASATIQSAGYEAKLTTRHNKGTVVYNIPAIEAQPWGAGCIVKAVNDKVFKAIVEAMSLDLNLFAKVEPGTTTLAVSIGKVEDKKP
jgi:hypothetical protein